MFITGKFNEWFLNFFMNSIQIITKTQQLQTRFQLNYIISKTEDHFRQEMSYKKIVQSNA